MRLTEARHGATSRRRFYSVAATVVGHLVVVDAARSDERALRRAIGKRANDVRYYRFNIGLRPR